MDLKGPDHEVYAELGQSSAFYRSVAKSDGSIRGSQGLT